jgi:hypothetical protein
MMGANSTMKAHHCTNLNIAAAKHTLVTMIMLSLIAKIELGA